MTEAFWGSIAVLVLIALVVVALVLWVLRSRRRSTAADEGVQDRYVQLAERSVASQQQTAAELQRLNERVESIESMLRDVG